ncbi:MAG: Ig-like domain-containing protein [Pseudomonadota bacterium]
MNRRTHTLLIGLTVALAGCGGGGGSNTISTPQPPPVDSTPPTLVSSEPVDGAGPVSIVTNPTVAFSEALDAATVSGASVSLINANGFRVRGEVRYDGATNSVIFSSTEPLAEGCLFTMRVDGVTDAAGNAASPISVTFRTFVAPLAQTVSYFEGAIVSQTDYENDANGLLRREIRRADAGADGVWQTGDETPRSYVQFERDANGNEISRIGVLDPGSDGQWFTPDDVIALYLTFDISANGMREVEWMAGDDGLLTTPDDVPRDYVDVEYNEFGEIIMNSTFRTPGDDGVWFNDDDDLLGAAVMFDYDDGGRLTLRTEALRGPDNMIGTADDVVEEYSAVTRNESQSRFEEVQYVGAGADGSWFTADDDIRSYRLEPFDSQGRPAGLVRGQGAGVDGVWLTADDEIRLPINSASYDDSDPAQTIFTTLAYNALGADNQPLTADDVISSVRIETLLDKSLRSTIEVYNAAGADGVWQTADDVLASRSVYERDADLNLLGLRIFADAGADGVPGTPDDAPGSEQVYEAPR